MVNEDKDLDVMFFWNDLGFLTLMVQVDETGEIREYDFSDEETSRLHKFLEKKVKKTSFITKVLKLFADN
ncbi:MAG: hypothetical protein DRQ35_03130 [Gammaproteobacteria bacterium]|nr:MAG: hypothetical protein DRQ35_03130 [Gammaproteobacteria bacterium]